MSEYQYYEFVAIDCPLTDREMKELRQYSSRATITPTRFVNFYTFGDFKGKPETWMEKYFDAFLYVANWGTHQIMFRLPKTLCALKTATLYCSGKSASVRNSGEYIIFNCISQDEGGDWEENGEGLLSSMISLRSDIARGDYRALYLAWLSCVQKDEIGLEVKEPPCPPGLNQLNASLKTWVEFLRIDPELLAIAATHSAPLKQALSRAQITQQIMAWPDHEKMDWLVRFAEGKECHLHTQLLRKLSDASTQPEATSTSHVRTVSELKKAAQLGTSVM